MLEEHQQLLAALRGAEALAAGLLAKGQNVERVLDLARAARECLEDRLRDLGQAPAAPTDAAEGRRGRRGLRLSAVLLSAVLLSGGVAHGQSLLLQPRVHTHSVVLAWDPSPSTNVVGYHIYYGAASGAYTNKVSVGRVTSATVSQLRSGATYFFAATAFTAENLESEFSNEVAYTTPSAPVRPPNVAILSASIQAAPSLASTNWVTITNLPTVLVTNAGATQFYRALLRLE